jgi:pimeloyl-ACP methyl ester carboxylesterase
MKPRRRNAWWRYLVAALVLGVLTLSTVYLVFPELVLKAQSAAARRSAGLTRNVVDVDGDHIVYLDGGSGTPVVLLHGFGANKDVWNTAAARLTPRFRVIVPDLPGFGESRARAGGRYDAWSQARRLHAFLIALGVREHHIGGSSMGGLIATVYAAQYPQDVQSLLVAAAAGVRSPRESELERHLAAGENPLLVRNDADLERMVRMVFYHPPSIPAPFRRAMLKDAHARNPT